ncbi:MAG: DUF5680 domain-containing protein [Patescibacteria group bacterium]
MIDREKLTNFLLAANQAGYASGDESKEIKEADGSKTIVFESGDWKSHDNFFGGEPYGGRTVVFYKNQPIWMMVYYGWVTDDIELDLVYTVLRNALKQMPANAPFRGPQNYQEDNLVYTNAWSGIIERFSGEEQILSNNTLIYRANYIGGLINQRT